ncbi:MAG TPA: AIR synthase-related protein, partial [Tepidisphaeraceae bacterium]|nr:AIR synthase-related protein [Tepidisphaeraceae bacterium]
AVLRPKLNTFRGIALGCGMCPAIPDAYAMAIASIDEAVRNVVAVGGNLDRVAILDNFCWPSVDDPRTMGTLVAACEACRDAAMGFRIPFISGKDSLHNQFTNQETGEILRIPNTLLISALSVIDDVRKCITMDLKQRGSRLCLVSARDPNDLANLAATHRGVAGFIASGKAFACHDVSDGGIAIAAAEMCIASGIGLNVSTPFFRPEHAFTERPGRYLVEAAAADDLKLAMDAVAEVAEIGQTQAATKLSVNPWFEIPIEELTSAWRGTLDW